MNEPYIVARERAEAVEDEDVDPIDEAQGYLEDADAAADSQNPVAEVAALSEAQLLIQERIDTIVDEHPLIPEDRSVSAGTGSSSDSDDDDDESESASDEDDDADEDD